MAAYFRCPACRGVHAYPTLDKQSVDKPNDPTERVGVHCVPTGRSMAVTRQEMFWKDDD